MENLLRPLPAHIYVPTYGMTATSYAAGVPANWSWRPEDHGAQCAALDEETANSMSLLIEGPIRSWDDIAQIELCLRALILHEKSYLLKPALMLLRQENVWDGARGARIEMGGQVIYSEPSLPGWLQSFLHSQGTGVLAVHDTWVEEDAKGSVVGSPFWVKRREQYQHKDQLDRAFSEYLATSDFGDAYALTPSALGLAGYLSNQQLREREKVALCRNRAVIPEKVLARLDEAWAREVLATGSIGLRVAIGPFLLVLCSRAANRGSLLKEIQCIREDFAVPRKKLWAEFGDIQTEHKLRLANNKARKLEAAMQSIVPAAFPKEEYPLKFGWDAARLAAELLLTGNLLPAAKYFVETAFQLNEHKRHVSKVEAAKVLAQKLHEADGFVIALRKHLSPEELRALGI